MHTISHYLLNGQRDTSASSIEILSRSIHRVDKPLNVVAQPFLLCTNRSARGNVFRVAAYNFTVRDDFSSFPSNTAVSVSIDKINFRLAMRLRLTLYNVSDSQHGTNFDVRVRIAIAVAPQKVLTLDGRHG